MCRSRVFSSTNRTGQFTIKFTVNSSRSAHPPDPIASLRISVNRSADDDDDDGANTNSRRSLPATYSRVQRVHKYSQSMIKCARPQRYREPVWPPHQVRERARARSQFKISRGSLCAAVRSGAFSRSYALLRVLRCPNKTFGSLMLRDDCALVCVCVSEWFACRAANCGACERRAAAAAAAAATD